MIIYPKAKVNLGLRIIERRSDGFHNLETLFIDLPNLTDILEIVESDKLSISLYGKSIEGEPGDNICKKAFELLSRDFGIAGAQIHLFKRIPIGAGLGGGSSNGACTLILLNEIYNLELDTKKLMEYASHLGSDCPYFIMAHLQDNKGGYTPAIAKGRGDKLQLYSLPILDEYEIEVKESSIFISTAEAYSKIEPQKPVQSLEEVLSLGIEKWRELLVNDFEKHTFKEYPLLQQYKQDFYDRGALYASMSGSGSAIYALFKKEGR